jgi:hypothetical protein
MLRISAGLMYLMNRPSCKKRNRPDIFCLPLGLYSPSRQETPPHRFVHRIKTLQPLATSLNVSFPVSVSGKARAVEWHVEVHSLNCTLKLGAGIS